MQDEDAAYVKKVAIGIAALFAVRAGMAIATPLSYDEAYYWLLSKHLAAGYYDHPPMFAVLIRLGTLVGGHSELGVRLFTVPLGIAASWALWRTVTILFQDLQVAARATLYFNLSLIAAGAFVAMTTDAPFLAASAFLMFFLAKIVESGRGAWWLAVGASAGFGMVTKYTMLFMGFSIVLWLLLVPEMRRWLVTPWPWLGCVLAAALFAPVILWNAEHDWVSFILQFGRANLSGRFPRGFIFGHVAGQITLATPFIFALGAMGLSAFLVGRGGAKPGRVLIGTMFWPMTIYFLWQSLNKLVLFHWTAPVFIPLAVAAAVAHRMEWRGLWSRFSGLSRRLAVPVALVLTALLYLHALFLVLPLKRYDIIAQQISPGRSIAAEIDAVRARIGADVVITTGYRLAGWLAFYLPSRSQVVQINERIRMANEPEPKPELFLGPLLYVMEERDSKLQLVRALYGEVKEVGRLNRIKYGYVLDTFVLYSVARPKGDPLDRNPPPSNFSQSS